MQRTIFLIPGFKQQPSDVQFRWLKTFLGQKGFRVVGVTIGWDYRTMSDYAEDFRRQYREQKSDDNTVLGFSYGAVIAFLTANECKPKRIYLCSLSPDFREDIGAMTPGMRKIVGSRRMTDAKKRSGKVLAKELSVPATVFYGETEAKKYPQLKIRCEETIASSKKKSKLVVVKEAPHKIDHPEYKKAIMNEFN